MIDELSIQNLKNRLDIVEVVGHYLELKRAGSSYKCLCPFHDDKNPSMNVSPNMQIYHCFSCGAGGDAIKFVMEYEKLSYPEAIEKLASIYNFSLTYIKNSKDQKEDKKILENLNIYYKQCLEKNQEALKYLKERGISASSIEKFQIGYAPNSSYTLNLLQNYKIAPQEAREYGVVEFGENGVYARFIERITFPIFSSSSKIVGFGGRTISSHPAKYINSPQTKVFNKSKLLYGYDLARQSILREKSIIITEGYLDVIMLHQAGFTNAVATLGTALTNEHLPLITRAEPKVILSYDGDEAGIMAALRAARMLSTRKTEGGVVIFANGIDPADMVQKNQTKELANLFAKPIPFAEFCLIQIIKNFNLKNPLQKQKALDEVIIYLKTLPEVIAEEYKSLASSLLGVKDAQIKIKTHQILKNNNTQTQEDMLELTIIKSLIIEPKLIDTVLDYIDSKMFKTHQEEIRLLLANQTDSPKIRQILLNSDIKVYNEEELKFALMSFLSVYYLEESEKIKNSKLDYKTKSFFLVKIRNILLNLKQGKLIPYESIMPI